PQFARDEFGKWQSGDAFDQEAEHVGLDRAVYEGFTVGALLLGQFENEFPYRLRPAGLTAAAAPCAGVAELLHMRARRLVALVEGDAACHVENVLYGRGAVRGRLQ